MNLRASCQVLAGALLCGCSLAAADGALNLRVRNRITVPQAYIRVTVGPTKCDSAGRVYVRPYQKNENSTVLRVSADGRELVSFSMRSQTAIRGDLFDYAAISDGSVYFLTSAEPGTLLVVEFDSRGRYRRTTQLETVALFPNQFAVLDSGEFVIAGHAGSTPGILFFDGHGRLVQTVKVPKDVHRKAGKTAAEKQQAESSYLQALELSIAEAGDDGNLYLARHTPEGPVIIVSPGGEILRTIPLTPPSKKAQLINVKAVSGSLIVVYAERDRTGNDSPRVQVLDRQTGELIRSYTSTDSNLGVGLACYLDGEFTFVGADDEGRMQILKVGAR